MTEEELAKLKADLKNRIRAIAPKVISEVPNANSIIFSLIAFLYTSLNTPAYGISMEHWDEFVVPRVQEYLISFLTRLGVDSSIALSNDEKIALYDDLEIPTHLSQILTNSLIAEINTAALSYSDIDQIQSQAVEKTFFTYLNSIILPQAVFEYLLQSHYFENNLKTGSEPRRQLIDKELRMVINGEHPTDSLLNEAIMQLSEAFSNASQSTSSLLHTISNFNSHITPLIRVGTSGGEDKNLIDILNNRKKVEEKSALPFLTTLAKKLTTKTIPEKRFQTTLEACLTEKGKKLYGADDAFKRNNVTEYLAEIRNALHDKKGLFDQQRFLNKILSHPLTRNLVLPMSIKSVLPPNTQTPSVETLKKVFSDAVTEYKKRTRFDKHTTFFGIAYWSLHHGEEGQKRVEELSKKINTAHSVEEISQLLINHYLHGAGGTRYKSFKPTLNELLSNNPDTKDFWAALNEKFISPKVDPLIASEEMSSNFSDTASEISEPRSNSSNYSRRSTLQRTNSDTSEISQSKKNLPKEYQYKKAICAHLDRVLDSANAKSSRRNT